jgi:tetratricopeptide (TPR) repeat protein
MARRKKKEEETLFDIVEARDSARSFIDRNQNIILGVITGIIILIGGYVLYQNLYQAPREREAGEQMFQAQFMFERDSFAAALSNPGGGYDGFLDIIDNYSGTNAANMARYYSAVSYLHLGQYQDAMEYINEFDAVGDVTPIMKAGVKGDIHSELGEYEQAMDSYEKAASYENDFLKPYYLQKLAMLQDRQGMDEEALANFKKIKADYPASVPAEEVEKYIGKLEQ